MIEMKLCDFLNTLRCPAILSVASPASAIEADTPESPRATLGDSVFEPAWEQRLTITIGPGNADILGTSDKAIRAAVDCMAHFGGGKDGFAVDVQDGTESIEFVGNEVTETRKSGKRAAIRLGPETSHITLRDNRIKGFAKNVEKGTDSTPK